VRFDDFNLNKPLINALNDLEFEYPTPVQERAYPVIMSGRDAVGIAQTGTGKTMAYLIPLLQNLKFSKERDPRILILVPTRELVLQVTGEIRKLTTYTNFRTAGIYGGANIKTQKDTIDKGLDILVATPGRLIDIAYSGVLRLRSIQKLVIDEVDEMLNLGFRAQITNILDLLPAKRQNLMFSATLTQIVEDLFAEQFNDPYKIEIAPHGTPIDKIVQSAYLVPNFHTKINLLEWLLNNSSEMSKVLVFVNTKRNADLLYDAIQNLFPDQVGVIHSNKSQNFRFNALSQFENGVFRILIATDVIARGLDITDVTHVINFETPEVPGDYIHRIGRTGRANKDGIAITFINESDPEQLSDIELLMKKNITVNPLPEAIAISKTLMDEEKPSRLYDKNYLKTPSFKEMQSAFHEKKGKNKKINLGGPKKRNPKHGKPASGQHPGQPKMTKKSRKTRF
jgi:ATP-dependent RNA helicase RhlE